MKWDLPQNVVPDRGHRFRCRDAAVEVRECYHTAWKLHRVCATARTRHGPRQPGAWRESAKGNSSKQCLAPSSRCRILSFAATTLPPGVNLSTVVDPTVEYVLIRIDAVRTPKVGLKRLMKTELGGNTPGQKTLTGGSGTEKQRFESSHLSMSGITRLYEGTTISYPLVGLGDLQVLATSSASA